MTSGPDPGDFSNGPPPSRRGFGAAYWASIIIGLMLILAGAAIGFFGPRLFPAHHALRAAGLAVAAVAWQPVAAQLNRRPRSRR